MPERGQHHPRQRPVIEEFRANGGRVGGYFADIPLLLLTTTGARSGQPRTSPLAYLLDEGRYVVMAADAGATRHPAWYHNLVADPLATVEIGVDLMDVAARVESGQRREVLYRLFVGQSPQLARYQAETTRRFPVVTLTPC